jgi:hypothetical protein
MGRRKGEQTPARIDREWPHQVSLPAAQCTGIHYSDRGVLPRALALPARPLLCPRRRLASRLRECSRAENMRNLKGRGTSGFKGVFTHRKKWLARICVNRKDHYLGVFNTKEEAAAAYDAAARILHGKFARLNAKIRNAKTARNDAQATRDASVRSYCSPKRLFTQE